MGRPTTRQRVALLTASGRASDEDRWNGHRVMNEPDEEDRSFAAGVAQEWLARVSMIYAQSIRDTEESAQLAPDTHPLYPSLVAINQTKQYLAAFARNAGDTNRMDLAAAIGSLMIAQDHLESVILHGSP